MGYPKYITAKVLYICIMLSKLVGWDDTIVALATAPGISAIAVIRISGSHALGIIDKLLPNKKIYNQPSHTAFYTKIIHDVVLIDEVVVTVFKAPKSYTGEDTVEISCHGNPLIQQQIIAACIAHGARLAKAGEYTQRAFLNSKIDLIQAEAVADLIAAHTIAAQKAALQNLRGGFSSELTQLREKLISFAALIELELDFAAEDVEFADRNLFLSLIAEILLKVQQLIASFSLGNVIKNGVSVAILGKPNAGKSTLLNVLLNEERAIVSEIPGTTRDTIEETINIDGILFRLIDTAGIRQNVTDIIENMGIEKSLAKMRNADIVLYLFDMATESIEDLQTQINLFKTENINYLLVANKYDTIEKIDKYDNQNVLYISAKHQQNIDVLKQLLFDSTVHASTFAENNIVTNVRHLQSLQSIEQSLMAIKTGLNDGVSSDLLTSDIRTALYHLGEITGEISNDNKLDFIFSKFCIGK